MKKKILVKICGLKDEESVEAAVNVGVDLIGVVFFANSPRYISVGIAAEILQFVPAKIKKVGLFVDPDDQTLNQAMNEIRLDFIQLHGHETVERVETIRQEFGMPVIKAISIATSDDIDSARIFDSVADRLLFDAKAPAGSDRPGGNAISFDWNLLYGRKWKSPWFLAGGLHLGNVAEAIRLSGATAVDVSSGVESSQGVKDIQKITDFVQAVRDCGEKIPSTPLF